MIKTLHVLRHAENEVIDLMYNTETHEFILRHLKWGTVRDAITLEGAEFVRMIQVGLEHYQVEQQERIDLSGSITDLLQ